jgi:hypothetical protein
MHRYNVRLWQVYGTGCDAHAYAADDVLVAVHAVM